MKVKVNKEETFKPVKVEITFETEEELNNYIYMLGLACQRYPVMGEMYDKLSELYN